MFFGLSTLTSILIPGSAFIGITLQFSFVTSLKIEFQKKISFRDFFAYPEIQGLKIFIAYLSISSFILKLY